MVVLSNIMDPELICKFHRLHPEVPGLSGAIPGGVGYCQDSSLLRSHFVIMHILSSCCILYLPSPLVLGVLTSCPCVLLYVLISAALP